MSVDWGVFATFAAPIATLFVGVALDRLVERRSRLVSYIAHTSAVTVQPPVGSPGQAFVVNSHSVVVRNTGRRPARNVRLGHQILTNFSVYPDIAHEILPTPGGGREILFPVLVPGEQVTIAYLYYPPLLWSNFNTYTKSDDGLAKILNVLPRPQRPRWLSRSAYALMAVGGVTVVYALVSLALFLVQYRHGN